MTGWIAGMAAVVLATGGGCRATGGRGSLAPFLVWPVVLGGYGKVGCQRKAIVRSCHRVTGELHAGASRDWPV